MACNGVHPKLKQKPIKKINTMEAVAAFGSSVFEYTPVVAEKLAKASFKSKVSRGHQ
jgi:hypothetical protein